MPDEILCEVAGATVTRTRLKVGGKTFPLRNVTSVEMGKMEASAAPVLFAGLVAVLVGACGLLNDVYGVVGLAAVILAVAVGLAVVRKARYVIVLETASGTTTAWSSTDAGAVQSVREAIEEALARG